MKLSDDALYRSILALRADAIERQMLDLAIVYGWAAIRRSAELTDAQLANLRKLAN